MKRFKSMLGATLLEVMLVLAIAAMIVIMSIRYYQGATNTAQANGYSDLVLTLSAAANNYAQSTGTYAGVTTSSLSSIIGPTGVTQPWGGTVTLTGTATNLVITPSGTPPSGVCNLVQQKFQGNSKYSATGCTVTYIP